MITFDKKKTSWPDELIDMNRNISFLIKFNILRGNGGLELVNLGHFRDFL